jgi:hypothetical protein
LRASGPKLMWAWTVKLSEVVIVVGRFSFATQPPRSGTWAYLPAA